MSSSWQPPLIDDCAPLLRDRAWVSVLPRGSSDGATGKRMWVSCHSAIALPTLGTVLSSFESSSNSLGQRLTQNAESRRIVAKEPSASDAHASAHAAVSPRRCTLCYEGYLPARNESTPEMGYCDECLVQQVAAHKHPFSSGPLRLALRRRRSWRARESISYIVGRASGDHHESQQTATQREVQVRGAERRCVTIRRILDELPPWQSRVEGVTCSWEASADEMRRMLTGARSLPAGRAPGKCCCEFFVYG